MSLTVDARGLRCPWPALRLARAMRDAEAVTIAADDPVAAHEIAALAAAQGWRIGADGPDRWRVERSVNYSAAERAPQASVNAGD